MQVKYKHTNLVARDWRKLSSFYEQVFGCRRWGPERSLEGPELSLGTGVPGAALAGAHLLLPGCASDGPTLEIFQFSVSEPHLPPKANREGFGHIAFEVESMEESVKSVLGHGGALVGEVSSVRVKGAGTVHFVYLADPEGNIIELQSWEGAGNRRDAK